MKSYFAKVGQMVVIGAATASLSLVTTIPVVGQVKTEDSIGVETQDSIGVEGDSLSTYTLAPNCVIADLDDRGFTDYLTVTNTCKTTQRIKVVLAFHTDKACRSIPPKGSVDYDWDYPGRFDRLELC